jgi:hypothetical protein
LLIIYSPPQNFLTICVRAKYLLKKLECAKG